MTRNYVKLLAISFAGVLLAGCGGSSSSDTGRIKLGLTDAPIDSATHVYVTFTGIELKPTDGSAFELEEFGDPRMIDLLDLQDGKSEQLVNASVPAGSYDWVRLMVDTSRNAQSASTIVLDDGSEHPLWVPSGDQTGLKLNSGITVPQGGESDYVIDFDLRKSVHKPMNGQDVYFLRPTLRLMDNTQVGGIAGTVDPTLLGENYEDGACDVYVFEGADVTPDDVDTVEGDDAEPLTTAGVKYDADAGNYAYTVGFLLPGFYTVALTCDAGVDDNELDNDDPANGLDPVEFTDPQNAEVVADQTTPIDFPPAP